MRLTTLLVLPLGVAEAFFGKRSTGSTSSDEISESEDIDRTDISFIRKAANIDRHDQDSSLTGLILQRLRNEEVFTAIQQTIESQVSLPTCNKLAYSTLVESCSDPHLASGEGKEGLDQTLDLVKTSFAARLAVCDLAEVGHDTVPSLCTYLLQGKQQPDSGDPRLHICLRGLHGDTKAWMSFINAKQNAITICHATRTHLERDAVIEQYRNFADVARNVSEHCLNSTNALLKVQYDALHAAQEFLAQLESAQLDHVHRSETINTDLQEATHLSKLLGEMLDAYTRRATAMAQQAEQHTTELVSRQDLLAEHITERNFAMFKDIQASHDIAVTLRGVVRQLRDDYVNLGGTMASTKLASQEINRYMIQHVQHIHNASTAAADLHEKLLSSGARLDALLSRLEGAFNVGAKIVRRLGLDTVWTCTQWMLWIVLAWVVLHILKWVASLVLVVGACLKQVTVQNGPLLLRWAV